VDVWTSVGGVVEEWNVGGLRPAAGEGRSGDPRPDHRFARPQQTSRLERATRSGEVRVNHKQVVPIRGCARSLAGSGDSPWPRRRQPRSTNAAGDVRSV